MTPDQLEKITVLRLLKYFKTEMNDENVSIFLNMYIKFRTRCTILNNHDPRNCDCPEKNVEEFRQMSLKIKHNQDFNNKLNDILNSD